MSDALIISDQGIGTAMNSIAEGKKVTLEEILWNEILHILQTLPVTPPEPS